MMTPATPMSDLKRRSARPTASPRTKCRKSAPLSVSVCGAIGLAGLISCGTGASATMPVKSVATVSVTVGTDPLMVPDSTRASATLRDSAGNTLSNRVVTWGSSDTAIATVSARGTVQAVRAGVAVIRASSENVTGSAALTIIAPSVRITDISRSAGSTAGGVVVQLTGSGFGTGDAVTFGGTPAAGVTLLNATTLQATVPPGSAGPVNVTVVHNGTPATLTNGFTYLLAPTTTIASTDFETGAIASPFYADVGANGSTTVSTAQAHRGTHSVLCQATTSTGIAGLSLNQSLSVMMDKDFYVRWYFLIPAATLTATANNGQIKLYLSRPNTLGTDQGWLMLGEGSEFNSSNNSFASRIDDGIVIVATGPVITPGVWHEVQIYQRWNSATGQGTSQVWFDGKLQGSATSSRMGGSDATMTYWTRMGLVYTQNAASYPLQVYVDDVVVANGFIDPTP